MNLIEKIVDKLEGRMSPAEAQRKIKDIEAKRTLRNKKIKNIGASVFYFLMKPLAKVLDRRVSVSKLVKTEDLVISNASLKELKRGIHRMRHTAMLPPLEGSEYYKKEDENQK